MADSGSQGRGAWRGAWLVCAGAARDLPRAWKHLAAADLLYKAIAFVLLTPLTVLLARWLVSRSGGSVLADADIALFLVTTRPGVLALLLVSTLLLAITALEIGSLMAIALGAVRGVRVDARGALVHAAAHAVPTLRLAIRIVLRLLALAVPFALAAGLAVLALLRGRDINYYLAEKPPAFWLAAVLVGALVAAFAALVVRRLLSWILSLPLVLFEGIRPTRALRASDERIAGRRATAALVLLGWAGASLALSAGVTAAFEGLGRWAAPSFSGSMPLLLFFIGTLAMLWGAAGLAVAVFNAAALALLVIRLYESAGAPDDVRLPSRASRVVEIAGRRFRVSWRALGWALPAMVLIAAGLAFVVFRTAWVERDVLVIAHRGAAARAPENTLAAFRSAIDDGADFVELDVQESADGVVVVAHDSDLSRAGGSGRKIWEMTAAEIREVDVGSRFSPEFAGERVPTLAEALALCKDKVRVNIELKSYGHDERLEARVVELVEAAGMERDIVVMSLDHDMIAKTGSLRPAWRIGTLCAKAIGDPVQLRGNFLAVERAMATRRFVRRAHRAGKDVYVWTVDDPAAMLRAMSLGVDGLITNKPALAREVVERHAALTQAERLLIAVLVRLGVHGERIGAAEDA